MFRAKQGPRSIFENGGLKQAPKARAGSGGFRGHHLVITARSIHTSQVTCIDEAEYLAIVASMCSSTTRELKSLVSGAEN